MLSPQMTFQEAFMRLVRFLYCDLMTTKLCGHLLFEASQQ